MPGELRDKGMGELNRRGIGYVYSAAHSTDDRAESVLRALNAPGQSR